MMSVRGSSQAGVTVKPSRLHRAAAKTAVLWADATTVGDALESLDLIAGEEGSYGLFVTTVDGVTLPSDGDQYWAFYIDGEYASTGVDQTEITAGASYALKAESM